MTFCTIVEFEWDGDFDHEGFMPPVAGERLRGHLVRGDLTLRRGGAGVRDVGRKRWPDGPVVLAASACAPATMVAHHRPEITVDVWIHGFMWLFHRNINWLPEALGKTS
jgi:hypothetical protein